MKKITEMTKISNYYIDMWELIPSNVELFVCESGNPQGVRVQVSNDREFERASKGFKNAELWYTK